MKRIRIIQIIGIILFAIYVGLFIIDLIWGILGEIDTLVFSIILAVISLSLIYKGVLLKSSSTLWFAISLILCAILIIILNFLYLKVERFYYVFSLIPILSSIFNLIIFEYKIYIKVIILNISIIIPIFCIRFTSLMWWWILIIGVVSLLIGIIICRLINFDKEKV